MVAAPSRNYASATTSGPGSVADMGTGGGTGGATGGRTGGGTGGGAPSVYNRIGCGYAVGRRTDPRWMQALEAALGAARTVVNVGAGTGSYESPRRQVVAVEPSTTMIAQRSPGAARVVRAVAEALPFADDAFDAATAVLTIHHWRDLDAYLDPQLRAGMSIFALMEPARIDAAMATLRSDLLDGTWARRNADLADLDTLDAGYLLLVADR